jgi:hypothetical protein
VWLLMRRFYRKGYGYWQARSRGGLGCSWWLFGIPGRVDADGSGLGVYDMHAEAESRSLHAPSPGSNELVIVIGLGGQKAVFGP